MAEEILIIGAGGTQCGYMLEAIARSGRDIGIRAIDRRWNADARKKCEKQGITTGEFDVIAQGDELAAWSEGVSLVVNLAGPGHLIGTRALDLAISLGADYMDICDDGDATEWMLDRQDEAKAAGIIALPGMGSSPGVMNILIRAAADALPESDELTCTMRWTGDLLDTTPAIVGHCIHCLRTIFPGEPKTPMWDELMPETVDFPEPIGRQEVLMFGHPEPITIPRFTRVRKVINKGGLAPSVVMHLIYTLSKLVDQGEPIEELVPIAMDYVERLSKTHERTGTASYTDIVNEQGDGIRYVSASQITMEHATGTPAAAGILLMLDKHLEKPGVYAPECLKPAAFFEALRLVSTGGGGLHAVRLEKGEPTEPVRIRDLISR